MDDNLYYVLVGTGVVSVLTLIYVLVDENLKQRRYEAQKAREAEQTAAEASQEIAVPPSSDPASPTSEAHSSEVSLESPATPSSSAPLSDPVPEPEGMETQTDVESPLAATPNSSSDSESQSS